MIGGLASRLRRLLGGRRRFERVLSDELHLHLELLEQDLVKRGLSPAEARRRARAEFGSIAAAEEACRETRSAHPLEALARDLRAAGRRLRGSPGYLIAAVSSLALGLGANTLVFSGLQGLLIAPLPFADADRIAWIFAEDAQRPGDSSPVPDTVVRAIAERARGIASLAVIDDVTLVREQPDRFALWRGLSVTPDLAEVLRINPALGRLRDTDDAPLPDQAIAIGHERWHRDFGGDPRIIGQVLPFADNKTFTIVGVLPAGVEFPLGRSPQSGNGSGFEPGVQDFWILSSVRAGQWPGGVVIARLREDATATQIELDAIVSNLDARADRSSLVLVPLRDQVLGVLKPALPLLQGFAALVLVAACANVANLMLARARVQRIDTAVRVALGATRRHLRRQVFAEALVVSTLGSMAGVGVAYAGRTLLEAAGHSWPLAQAIVIDASALVLLIVLGAATTVVFAILGGSAQGRSALSTVLAEGYRGAPPKPSRTLRVLVAAQLALSVAVLAGAGALRTSLHRLLDVDRGYQTPQVLTADVLLYVPKAQHILRDVYARIRALPGIAAVGVIHSTPLTGKWSVRDRIEIIDGDRRRLTGPMIGSFVAFDYFQAMGIDLVAGRFFTDEEALAPKPRAVIINDLAARTYFDGHAVGARLFMYGSEREVVGVVRATRDVRLDLPPEPQFYQPMFFDGSQIIMRVHGDPRTMVEPVRQTLLDADRRLIVRAVQPLDAIVAERVAERRLAASLVTAFGALALAIAAVGLAGVLHFNASSRWRELGLRAALGATRRQLMGLVARDALGITAAGLASGVLLAAASGRLLEAVLFQSSVLEAGSIAGVAALLTAVCAASALVPAWRSGRVDPMTAMRR